MLKEAITEFMKSVDLQPLQYLAAARVAIAVCESEDMQCMIGRFHKTDGNSGFSDGQWSQLRGKVKRKLNQLFVADSIINVVLENLWPISFEISKWILYHAEDTGIVFSSEFCWTPKMAIDYVKTAEVLVKDQALDIKKRFKLACIYCLESEVRSLWDEMCLSKKRLFFVRGNLQNSDQNPIVLYWTYYIQEVSIDYWSSEALNHMRLFEYASENGYLSATKFFLGQLKPSPTDRLFFIYLHKLLEKLYYSEKIMREHLAIAFFFICHISSDYEGFVVTTLSFRYFLEWPYQKHFMTVVNQHRQHFTAGIFMELLSEIFEKEMKGFKDYNYKKLFKEFWYQSPEEYKTHARTQSRVGFKIFMKFVKKHFGFVFEESSSDLKAKFRAIVFQQEIPEDVTNFEKENVDFFKFLVLERIATKSFIHNESYPRFREFLYKKDVVEFFDLPLSELNFLIDGILLDA